MHPGLHWPIAPLDTYSPSQWFVFHSASCESLKAYLGRSRLTIISDEPHNSMSRVDLSYQRLAYIAPWTIAKLENTKGFHTSLHQRNAALTVQVNPCKYSLIRSDPRLQMPLQRKAPPESAMLPKPLSLLETVPVQNYHTFALRAFLFEL